MDAVQAELDKRTEDDLDELAERDNELGQAKTETVLSLGRQQTISGKCRILLHSSKL